MTNKEALVKVREYLTNLLPIEDSDEVEEIMSALEQGPCETIKEIPKDYKYDTETEDFLVYRHIYTGHEIHIEKPIPRYRLEQQPCEYAISREAVLNYIDEHSKMIIRPNEFKEHILDFPPVTPKQKVGKPIYDETYHTYQCPNCRKIIGKTINFCSNCGAKMQGIQETDKEKQ